MRKTALEIAFNKVGVETPPERLCKIALDCWEKSKYRPSRQQGGGPEGHDPIRTMKMFEACIHDDLDLVHEIVKKYWFDAIKVWLAIEPYRGGWEHASAWRREIRKSENSIKNKKRTGKTFLVGVGDTRKQAVDKYHRDKNGIKSIRAHVNVKTGEVKLIDSSVGKFKDYKIEGGVFSSIKINGRDIWEVTTEEALTWCDKNVSNIKFVRSLCRQIPDPRKSIGEQVTVDMVKIARMEAESS